MLYLLSPYKYWPSYRILYSQFRSIFLKEGSKNCIRSRPHKPCIRLCPCVNYVIAPLKCASVIAWSRSPCHFSRHWALNIAWQITLKQFCQMQVYCDSRTDGHFFFLQDLLSVFSVKPIWNSISALIGTESLNNTMFNHVTYNIRYKSSGM